MAIAKPLHLRLFMEGIEVPVVAAQVSIGINAPSAASIQLIPIDSGFSFHPRTMVHLFFRDANPKAPADPTKNVIDSTESTLEGDYRLLFAGEIVSFQYQLSPMSRGLIVQCVDFSSYWDAAHATAIEYGQGGNWATHTASLYGSNAALFDDIVNQMANRLVGWLNSTPRTPGLETVSGLAGGLIRMLESIGGVPGHSKGVNDFFTVAELRCRVLAQITAEENDSTAANLLYSKVLDEWIRNGLQNIGQQVTYRDLMKLLFQYIYYEAVPNPASKFFSGEAGKSSQKKMPKASIGSSALGSSAAANIRKIGEGCMSYQTDAEANIANYSRIAEAFLGKLETAKKQLQSIKGAGAGQAGKYAKTLQLRMDELTKIKNGDKPADWTGFTAVGKGLVELATKIEQDKTEVGGDVYVATSTGTVQRLHSQIIRPDCWFVAPPTCNVIFPEQYVTLAYERNYLTEVSRVLIQLYNTLVGQERLLSTKILSPYITSEAKKLVEAVGGRSYRTLMDHEKHTGIVPREEWLPNTNAVPTAADGQVDATKAKDVAGRRVSWARRIALFQFYKYRFANRQASVGMRFSPQLVCGFPALVIRGPYYPDPDTMRSLAATTSVKDPTDDFEFAITHAEQLRAPTHLLGMVGTISHAVGQEGGTTTMTMHHVRHHSGSDDEFLKIAMSLKSLPRNVRVRLNYEDISKLPAGDTKNALLNYLATCTPQTDVKRGKAKVEEGEKVPPDFTQYAKDDAGAEILIPYPSAATNPGDTGPFKKGKVTKVVVTNSKTVSRTIARKGKDGKQQSGSQRLFSEVVVTVREDIPVNVGIPAEEVFFPNAWFSQKYKNDRIGKEIYNEFFGCWSIIDSLAVQTPDGETVTTRDTSTTPDPAQCDGADLDVFLAGLRESTESRYSYTIEKATNAIAYMYGKVKQKGGDVDSFIRQFTSRPIATKSQILGDEDLEFDIDSEGKVTPRQVERDGKKVTPFVGFHSCAVHPQIVEFSQTTRLAGLLEDLTLKISRINQTGESKEILGTYDMRWEKRTKVQQYYEDLMGHRAFRG